jgi:hypothetical protein
MNINKSYIILGLVIAFGLIFELAAHADVFDLATTITFSQPIQVPGQVLPAGTYLIKLANRDPASHVVQIFSPDRTVLYGTFMTMPTDRSQPTNDTAVTFAEPESGVPAVLVKWFYPGNETGNEFVYSKRIEKELAQDTQQTIVATQPSMLNSGYSGAGN